MRGQNRKSSSACTRGICVYLCARYEVSLFKAVTGTAVHKHGHGQPRQHTTGKARPIGMYARWAKTLNKTYAKK